MPADFQSKLVVHSAQKTVCTESAMLGNEKKRSCNGLETEVLGGGMWRGGEGGLEEEHVSCVCFAFEVDEAE